jgi:hypothetical protein
MRREIHPVWAKDALEGVLGVERSQVYCVLHERAAGDAATTGAAGEENTLGDRVWALRCVECTVARQGGGTPIEKRAPFQVRCPLGPVPISVACVNAILRKFPMINLRLGSLVSTLFLQRLLIEAHELAVPR